MGRSCRTKADPEPSADNDFGSPDLAACERYVKILITCGAKEEFLAAAFAKGTRSEDVTKAEWKKELASFKQYKAHRTCREMGNEPGAWPFSTVSQEDVLAVLAATPDDKDCAAVGKAIHANGFPFSNGE